MIYAWGEEKRDTIEKGIIQMMDRHNWWRQVGMGRPAVLPDRISDIAFLMEGSKSGDFMSRLNKFVLYHRLTGKALGTFGLRNLELNYYACRTVSAAFFLAGLILIFLTFRLLAAGWDVAAGWGIYFVLFLPQFLLTSVAVNPDAFALFLSSVFLYAAYALMTGRVRGAWAVLLFVPAGLGFLADRSLFFLAVLAVLAPLFLVRRDNYQRVIILTLFFAVLTILFFYFLALKFPFQFENSLLTGKSILHNFRKAVPSFFSLDAFHLKYWGMIADSFLLKFGWHVFSAPKVAYEIWRLFFLGSLAGLLIAVVKFVRDRWKEERETEIPAGSPGRRLAVFSLAAVFIQAFGLWSYYGVNNIFGQGRYFFPVIVPVAAFFLIGLRSLGDAIRRNGGRIAITTALILEFFFLGYTLWHDIVPVFHLIIKSPYVGI